uniref:Uncharacterized protein n=1 Tax=Lepeophtheirus salmonis TaxID=72036 RepID=A0A0K2UEY1_LEPSM
MDIDVQTKLRRFVKDFMADTTHGFSILIRLKDVSITRR